MGVPSMPGAPRLDFRDATPTAGWRAFYLIQFAGEPYNADDA